MGTPRGFTHSNSPPIGIEPSGNVMKALAALGKALYDIKGAEALEVLLLLHLKSLLTFDALLVTSVHTNDPPVVICSFPDCPKIVKATILAAKEDGCALLELPLQHHHTTAGTFILLRADGYFTGEEEALLEVVVSMLSMALSRVQVQAEIATQEAENSYLQEEIQTANNYSEIIGPGMAMRNVLELVSQVAPSLSSVLILGETGTGKELIARALHNASSRSHKLMVKINCASLPPSLIESELFGHEKGSFTGAIERRIGKFELANNSTLFLDEVGELPLDLQAKLLRALQEKEIERVGGQTVIRTNVRVIAATNRDLEKEVLAGNFRSDLFYRLNVFPVVLPPLRERREDIPVLAAHLVQKTAKKLDRKLRSFSARAMKQLMAYSWPGNVRELEHIIERSMLLAKGNVISQVPLPEMDAAALQAAVPDAYVKTIDEVEREHIIAVLRKTNGKVAGIGGAAALLRIPSTTLNSKIRRLQIKKGFINQSSK